MKRFVLIAIILLLIGTHDQYVTGTSEKTTQGKHNVNYNHSLVFLLLGVDERPGDTGRSDAIFLATVNPYTKSIMLTNIPRDTYVKIPGKKKDKLNHSYMFGGEMLTKQTIERFLKVPIDGYAKINMQSLKVIVDRIGGIEVDVPFGFIFHGWRFYKGKMKLNGEQALAYSRMRKKDPNGDLGRNTRQFQVIKGIIKKATQPQIMLRIIPLVQEVMKMVKTDVPMMTVLQLAYTYHDVKMDQFVTNQLKGDGVLMDGIYYYIVERDEVKKFQKIINQHKTKGIAG